MIKNDIVVSLTKLIIATLLPVFLSQILDTIDRKTKLGDMNYWLKQVIIGLLFGGLAVIGNEWGITIRNAQLNCRDAAVLTAGLFFGSPAGIIAGIIGGLERWFAVRWGLGYFTRLACTISTIFAGFYAASLREYILDKKRPSWFLSLCIGVVMEAIHMTMVFITNINAPTQAIIVVKACALPMIGANGLSVMLTSIFLSIINHKHLGKEKHQKRISEQIQRSLLITVVMAYLCTSYFVIRLWGGVAESQSSYVLDIAIYINTFMEIIVFAILFGIIYRLVDKVVVKNIESINTSLGNISAGNLDESVEVRSSEEFSKLSDDINLTVDTLKNYIDEASKRIDQELALAEDIQSASLPSIFPAFPNRPDIDIYAIMDPAKEVGGDFYDFYLNGDNLNFLVADVSGKGIPAAMFMMRAKTELKSLTDNELPIESVFQRGNSALCDGNEAMMFVTAWQGKVDLSNGHMEFVNAGHNPPLIKKADGSFEYVRDRSGFILAIKDNMTYKRFEINLDPGDTVFLYTDGVTEATNAQEELYGEERLQAILNAAEYPDMATLCAAVKENVDAFVGEADQFDDITMLAFKYVPVEYPTIKFEEAKIEDVAALTDFADEQLEEMECPIQDRIRIDIAIDEIFSNIVKYGYPSEPGPVDVRFRKLVNPGGVELTFTDHGVPYNPLTAKEPDINLPAAERQIGGLGIYMVKNTMDDIKYEYSNDKNILRIIKYFEAE